MGTRELLEAEDEDERQKRLGQLLMRVDQTGDNAPSTVGSSTTPPINQIAGGSTPVSVEPPVELLDRVRQFLPQLAESNASLSSRDQNELDIENISEGGSHYIEMNLGLGVFEYGRRETLSEEGSSTSSSSSSSSTSELDSEDSDGSSSDSSSNSEDSFRIAPRPKKPLPRRARPSITVLNEPKNPPGGS